MLQETSFSAVRVEGMFKHGAGRAGSAHARDWNVWKIAI
jgi:hypothetical protein